MTVAYDLSTHFLLALKVLHAAGVQWIGHLVHHWAVTVTFSVLRHAACPHNSVLLVLGDNLLSLDSVFL